MLFYINKLLHKEKILELIYKIMLIKIKLQRIIQSYWKNPENPTIDDRIN